MVVNPLFSTDMAAVRFLTPSPSSLATPALNFVSCRDLL
jgi:hypothetical protein